MVDKEGYTQRQWDRVVGYGKVPKEYALRSKKEKKDV
tara:strand:- start:1907 stop:2017 length:111 start_codon:yes stop_codon:yes gene_type:complete